MKIRAIASLGVLLSLGVATAALSQAGADRGLTTTGGTPIPADQLPPGAYTPGTGPITTAPRQGAAPGGAAAAPGRAGGGGGGGGANAAPAGPPLGIGMPGATGGGGGTNAAQNLAAVKHLLYVSLPGSLERPIFPTGHGITVLDADNNYAFVKNIPFWNYAASMTPEDVSGIAASPALNMLFLSVRGRLGAMDLATEKLVWSTTLDGACCERPIVSADGTSLVVNSNLRDYIWKLDAKTGKVIAKIETPGSSNMHNINLSADGKFAYASPNGRLLSVVDLTTNKTVRTIPFQDNVRVQVLNKDASKIYVNQNNFLGYLVADTKTGQILQTVEVTSVDWRKAWNVTPRPRVPHGCPSHGIAISQDGKEVWLADALFHKIHVFSNDENPKEIATIDTPDNTYWMTFSVDGKRVYASSGDIIDADTKKIIGTTKDQYGNRMFSEKVLDMVFRGNRLQRVSNQFGNEYGDFVTAERMGVAPHMPLLAGNGTALSPAAMGLEPNPGLPQAPANRPNAAPAAAAPAAAAAAPARAGGAARLAPALLPAGKPGDGISPETAIFRSPVTC